MSRSNGNQREKDATLSRKSQLDATQKLVAEEIAYKGLTGKKEEDIASEYGINRTTIWRWKSLPQFNDEVNRIVKEYQKSHLVDVNNILVGILTNGSEKYQLKAIELYYRNQGLFRENVEITEKMETTVNIDDILQQLDNM